MKEIVKSLMSIFGTILVLFAILIMMHRTIFVSSSPVIVSSITNCSIEIQADRSIINTTCSSITFVSNIVSFTLTDDAIFTQTNGCVTAYSSGGIRSFSIDFAKIDVLTIRNLKSLRVSSFSNVRDLWKQAKEMIREEVK